MTMAHWNKAASAALPQHAHAHEQITKAIVSEFQMTNAGETKRLRPQVAVISSNVPHSGKALPTQCHTIGAFHSVHEDYRNGTC